MRKYLLLLLLLSSPAFAQTTQLPGNTTVNTNPANRIIIRDDDESLAYRTLVKPHLRDRYRDYYHENNYPLPQTPNTVPYGAVNQACAGTRNTSEQNRCIRDVIKAQEKIRDKYN